MNQTLIVLICNDLNNYSHVLKPWKLLKNEENFEDGIIAKVKVGNQNFCLTKNVQIAYAIFFQKSVESRTFYQLKIQEIKLFLQSF
jgi:hypothetical protein